MKELEDRLQRTDGVDHAALNTRLFGGTDLTHRVDLDGEAMQAFLQVDSEYDFVMERRHFSAWYAFLAIFYSDRFFWNDPENTFAMIIELLNEETDLAAGIMERDGLAIEHDCGERDIDVVFRRTDLCADLDPMYARLLEIRRQLPLLLPDDFFPELRGE